MQLTYFLENLGQVNYLYTMEYASLISYLKNDSLWFEDDMYRFNGNYYTTFNNRLLSFIARPFFVDTYHFINLDTKLNRTNFFWHVPNNWIFYLNKNELILNQQSTKGYCHF